MTFTETTICMTREWFYQNKKECLEQAMSGELRVNDIEDYKVKCETYMRDIKDGKYDRCFAFLQRCEYIQTGKCTPFLPEVE